VNSPSPHPTASTSDAAVSHVFVREGFRWDEQGAYLFDVDGTLLRSRDRVHVDSFFSSVRTAMGRELVLDGVTLSGNTDPGILRDAFRLARLDEALAARPGAAALGARSSLLAMSEALTKHAAYFGAGAPG